MIKYVLRDPDAKDNREYIRVLGDTGQHDYCKLQEATTFDARSAAANECEGSEEVVPVEVTTKYAFTAGHGGPDNFFRIRQGVLFACTKTKATLFDSEELAHKAAPRSNYKIAPVEVPEPVSSIKAATTDTSMSIAGYIVQIGDTNRFVALVNGRRMSALESQATVFTSEAAAVRATTFDGDKVVEVFRKPRTASNRWVVYNPMNGGFLTTAEHQYYTDQIDEATWFTTEADAQAKCLTGEVVRRVNITWEGN